MPQVTINVELRNEKGHRTGRALRREGRIPGVFYTHGQDAISVSMNARELKRILNAEVNILDVVFPDKKGKKSVLREVQVDPVTEEPLHVDIMGISLKEKIRLKIPIILKGTPIGVKDQGGVLVHSLREIEVEGLPLDIPEHIEIEISGLNIGDAFTVGKIPTEKFVLIIDKNEVIANVIHPRVIEEAVLEEEGEEEAVAGEEQAKGKESESEE